MLLELGEAKEEERRKVTKSLRVLLSLMAIARRWSEVLSSLVLARLLRGRNKVRKGMFAQKSKIMPAGFRQAHGLALSDKT